MIHEDGLPGRDRLSCDFLDKRGNVQDEFEDYVCFFVNAFPFLGSQRNHQLDRKTISSKSQTGKFQRPFLNKKEKKIN